jgi:glycosyltransferase involved in cell wall biosynthesis
MRDDLKVSLIIPGYKCDEFLFRNIESILDQDYENYEIIFVPNGEWETKGELIQAVQEKYGDKVNVLSLDYGNLGNANNEGFALSKGDIISHLSSDLYLMPGALRNWVETFQENPQYGMVYSGYKLVSKNPLDIYHSNPYDRYHLECENFIDGANPVKRSAWRKWSTDLKSLIDWDWALSVTKDSDAFYIKEPLYYAELPKEGGLSQDSDMNWIVRRRAVQEKHGIPDRKICISSLLDSSLALEIAKITGNDFRIYPGMKPHEYRLIYCYGFMCDEDSIQRSTGIFAQHYGHKIIHWAGPDINSFMGTWNLSTAMAYYDYVLKRINSHWVTTKRDMDLLKWIHLEPDQVFLPVHVDENPDKMVAISVNNYDLADQLKKAMPDQEIRVNDVSCSITVHFDDKPTNITHSLCRGNYVIANQNYQGAYWIQGFTNVPELRKMLVHTIRRIQREKPKVDKEDIDFYRLRVNPDNFKRKLQKIADKEIKKYAKFEGVSETTRGVWN